MSAKEKIIETIANTFVVGLRKGVYEADSYNLMLFLNNGYDNSDKRITSAVDVYIQSIAESVAEAIVNKKTREEIAQAMKIAATTLVPKQEGEFQIRAENQGYKILQTIFPFEYESYGRTFIAEYENDCNQISMMASDVSESLGRWGSIPTENVKVMGAMILKFIKQMEIEHCFKTELQDNEEEFRLQLKQTSEQTEDGVWKELTSWVFYVLKENDIEY